MCCFSITSLRKLMLKDRRSGPGSIVTLSPERKLQGDKIAYEQKK
jgi:hypothetical protein